MLANHLIRTKCRHDVQNLNTFMDSLSDNHLSIIATSVNTVKVEHEWPFVHFHSLPAIFSCIFMIF